MNFEEKKKQHKEVTENSDASSNNLKSESKSKLRRHRNVVKKSQSESKKFDAIDVGLKHGPVWFDAVRCSLM